MEYFLDVQIAAVRATDIIQPGPFIHAHGVNHKRVIVHPLANRIPVPPRFGIFGKFSPVRPDDAPIVVELIQEKHLVLGLSELDYPEFKKLHARETLWVTEVHRVIYLPRGDCSDARSRFIGSESFFPESCVGRMAGDTFLVGLAKVAWFA